MMALSALATCGRADETLVAWRGAEALSFGRFRAEVGGAATRLAGCHRAALVCQDRWRFAVGLFGLLAAGATVVLPPNAQPGTLAGLAGEFDWLVDDSFTAEPGEWSEALDGNACRLEFFTSGSTGGAKRICRTLAQLEGETEAVQALFGQAVGGVAPTVATVSHQHVYGLIFALLWPLAAGRPFSTLQYDLWESLLADLPPGAVVVSSPAHLTRLGGLAPLSPVLRPSLLLSAGAPLPDAAVDDAARVLGIAPTEIYGSTETGAIASRSRAHGAPSWKPLPGGQVRRTEAGLLAVAAPYLDGWVDVADLVEMAPEGGFHLNGRADRVAKIEGKRVGLDEVERGLLALPEVADAAIVVLTDTRDVLAAVVVPSVEGRLHLSRLGAFRFTRLLRRALASTQEPAGLPRRWRFVDALPTGELGKRQAPTLAALFEEADHD